MWPGCVKRDRIISKKMGTEGPQLPAPPTDVDSYTRANGRQTMVGPTINTCWNESMKYFSQSTSYYQHLMSHLCLLLVAPPPPRHGRGIKLWLLSIGSQQVLQTNMDLVISILSYWGIFYTLLFIFSVVFKSLRCSFCSPIKLVLVSFYWQRDSQFSLTG